jgi:hypothetical protein
VENLTDFEQKFSSPPYMAEASYRGGIFYGRAPVRIAPKLIEQIGKRAGNLLSADDVAALKGNFTEEQKLQARMNELSFYSVTVRWQKLQAEAAEKIKRGEPQVSIPDRQQILSSISAERQIVHGLLREIYTKNFGVLKPACDRFAKAARQFCLDLDQQERADHLEAHGDVPFEPSVSLRGLAYIALAITEQPVKNFLLCGNLPAPNLEKNPVISIWLQFNPQVVISQPVPVPVVTETAERQKQVTAEAQAAASKAHAEALVEKNKLVADFKAKLAADAEEKELDALQAEQDAAAHRADLQKKLAAKTQPAAAGDTVAPKA